MQAWASSAQELSIRFTGSRRASASRTSLPGLHPGERCRVRRKAGRNAERSRSRGSAQVQGRRRAGSARCSGRRGGSWKIGAKASAFAPSSSWLASLLGEVRDRDVLIDYLVDELDSLDGAAARRGSSRSSTMNGNRRAAIWSSHWTRRGLRSCAPRLGIRRGSGKAKPSVGRRNASTSAFARPPRRSTRMRSTRTCTKRGSASKRVRYAAEAGGVGGSLVDRAKSFRKPSESTRTPLSPRRPCETCWAGCAGRDERLLRQAVSSSGSRQRKERARRAWPAALETPPEGRGQSLLVSDPIRAAGGVVRRRGDVLLVHRPKYGDWTFPKGKAKGGESDEDCALREVEEETGLPAPRPRAGEHSRTGYWRARRSSATGR